jgi:hypothetical protein
MEVFWVLGSPEEENIYLCLGYISCHILPEDDRHTGLAYILSTFERLSRTLPQLLLNYSKHLHVIHFN